MRFFKRVLSCLLISTLSNRQIIPEKESKEPEEGKFPVYEFKVLICSC